MTMNIDAELQRMKESMEPEIPSVIKDRIRSTLASLPAIEDTFPNRHEQTEEMPERKKRRTRWRWALGAVALLLLLSSMAAFSIPTFAGMIRLLFNRDTTDIGLLNAQELGLLQNPGIKVTDQGYTVDIHEAVADPTRVVMALQLFGPDGGYDGERLQVFGKNKNNRIEIKDEQGNIVGRMYNMGKGDNFYYMVAMFPEPLRADRITVEGHISNLNDHMKNLPEIHGNWNFSFPMDMTQANKKTNVMPLHDSYTSPGGMTVRFKKITHMVQGVRLEIDTQLSDEALARSPGDLWKQQSLRFHFSDQKGEEITSLNTLKSPNREHVMSQFSIPGDKPGLMHWSYTFMDLPQGEPYQFVLDGYAIAERDGSAVDFVPSRLKQHPVRFHTKGDEFMLKDFTVRTLPYTTPKHAAAAVHVSGILSNNFKHDQYLLRDASGKEYEITINGSYSGSGKGWKDGKIILEADRPGELMDLRAESLTTIPEHLTLIRTVVDRVYTNTNWSVTMEYIHKIPNQAKSKEDKHGAEND